MRIEALQVSDDAERTILGSILLNNSKLYEVETALRLEHFGSDVHRRIFSAMLTLSEAGQPFESLQLVNQLQKCGDLDKVGGVEYISELIDGAIEDRSLEPFMEMVLDQAKRRHLRVICEAVRMRTEDPTQETEGCLTTLEDTVFRLRTTNAAACSASVQEIVPEVLNEMEAIRQMPSEAIGFTTGLLSVDRATTGIRPDEYWVVGALPSRGKTVLGVQIAVANAKKRIPVLFFSHEMTRRQLVRRILPAESGLSASKIRDPRYTTDAEMRIVQETAAEIAQWPMWVVDPDQLSARELVAIARQHIRRHGVRLIIVDYLQLIQSPEKERRERVGTASNALRSIPKTEGVPVVALSQLARPRDRDENSRPSMTDLKESGDIEAHAHTVLLLYRPRNPEGEWTGEDEVIIAKQREGLVGYERVWLDGKKLQFVERER